MTETELKLLENALNATYAALPGGEPAITTSYVPNDWSETQRVCKHINLARSCELCERDARIKVLEDALRYIAKLPQAEDVWGASAKLHAARKHAREALDP